MRAHCYRHQEFFLPCSLSLCHSFIGLSKHGDKMHRGIIMHYSFVHVVSHITLGKSKWCGSLMNPWQHNIFMANFYNFRYGLNPKVNSACPTVFQTNTLGGFFHRETLCYICYKYYYWAEINFQGKIHMRAGWEHWDYISNRMWENSLVFK